MNQKGFGGIIPTVCRRDGGKIMKTTVRIADVSAKIRTEHLPNTSLQRHLYNNQLSEMISTSM